MTATRNVVSSNSGVTSFSSQSINIGNRSMNKSNLSFDTTCASCSFSSLSSFGFFDSSMDSTAMHGASNPHPVYNNKNSNSLKNLLPAMWNKSNIHEKKVNVDLLSSFHMQRSHASTLMLCSSSSSSAGDAFSIKIPQDLSSCSYEDSSGSLSSTLPAIQRSLVPPIFYSCYKMSLCNFYKKGRCRNGQTCRFAHGISELRGPPPKKQPGKKKKKKKDFREDEYHDNSNTNDKTTSDILCLLESVLKKGSSFDKKAGVDKAEGSEDSTLDDLNSLSAKSIKELVVSLQNLLISKNKTTLKNEVRSCKEKENRELNICGSSRTSDVNAVNNIISDFVNSSNKKEASISLDKYLVAAVGNENMVSNNDNSNLFNGNMNKISERLISSMNDNLFKNLSLSDTEASNNEKVRRKSRLNSKYLSSYSFSSVSLLIDDPSPFNAATTTATAATATAATTATAAATTATGVSTNSFMNPSQLPLLGSSKHLQTSTLAALAHSQQQYLCPTTIFAGVPNDDGGGDAKLSEFEKMQPNPIIASLDQEMQETCPNEKFFLESLKAMTNQDDNDNNHNSDGNSLLSNINHAILMNNSLSSQSSLSLANEVGAFDTSSSPFNWTSSSSLFPSRNLNKLVGGPASLSRSRSPIAFDNNAFGLSSVSSPSSSVSSPHSLCTTEILQTKKMPFGPPPTSDTFLSMDDSLSSASSLLSFSSSSLLQNSLLLSSLCELLINRLKEKNDASFLKAPPQQQFDDDFDDFRLKSLLSKSDEDQNLEKNLKEAEELLLKRWRDTETLNSFFANGRVDSNEFNDIGNHAPNNLSNFLSHISPTDTTSSSSSYAYLTGQEFKADVDTDDSWLPMKYSMFNSFGAQEAVEEPTMQDEPRKNLGWFYSSKKNDTESNHFHNENINLMNNVL